MREISLTSDYRQALTTIKQYIQSSQQAGELKPEYIGKLNYLSGMYDQLRAFNVQLNIGLILRNDKDKLGVKYVLCDIHKPLGVSSFITRDFPLAVQSRLPSVEKIESELAQGHGEPSSND